MNKSTILRTTFFILLIATFAASKDKTPPTYQKGTISGYETRMDTKVHSYGNGNFGSATRHTKVYELKGADLVYQIDDCGSFQSGKFDAGQSVDYRVDGERLYILHDNDKEYKCKIEGTRAVEGAKPAAPAAKQ